MNGFVVVGDDDTQIRKEFYTALKSGDLKRIDDLLLPLKVLDNKILLYFYANETLVMVTNKNDWTFTLAVSKQVARWCLDVGILVHIHNNSIISSFISHRQQLRQCALITLCASRSRSRYRAKGGFADILQIIARCVWSARLTESFWFE